MLFSAIHFFTIEFLRYFYSCQTKTRPLCTQLQIVASRAAPKMFFRAEPSLAWALSNKRCVVAPCRLCAVYTIITNCCIACCLENLFSELSGVGLFNRHFAARTFVNRTTHLMLDDVANRDGCYTYTWLCWCLRRQATCCIDFWSCWSSRLPGRATNKIRTCALWSYNVKRARIGVVRYIYIARERCNLSCSSTCGAQNMQRALQVSVWDGGGQKPIVASAWHISCAFLL